MNQEEYLMAKFEQWIKRCEEKLAQHKDNLALWENGFLAPTEPDEQERECTIRELKAAISTLEWCLNSEFQDTVWKLPMKQTACKICGATFICNNGMWSTTCSCAQQSAISVVAGESKNRTQAEQ